jgi:hypothetical protein
LPEAAAGAVDCVELALDNGAGHSFTLGVSRRDHGGGAERPEGKGHVPPETTTGGACVCTGGAAGAVCVAALWVGTSGGGVARWCVVRTCAVVTIFTA